MGGFHWSTRVSLRAAIGGLLQAVQWLQWRSHGLCFCLLQVRSEYDRVKLRACKSPGCAPVNLLFVLKRMSTWNGNVDLILLDAMMFITIFNDDAALFQEGIARLATRVPAYFYLESVDPTPKYVLQCSVQYIWSLLALGGPRALLEVPCIVGRLIMTSR